MFSTKTYADRRNELKKNFKSGISEEEKDEDKQQT